MKPLSCGKNKYINPKTGRCVLETNKDIVKLLKPSKKGPKPVGPKPVGPKPVGPKPVGPKPVGPKPVGPKPVGPKTVNCKGDKIINPSTGRCVLKTGKIGKELLKVSPKPVGPAPFIPAPFIPAPVGPQNFDKNKTALDTNSDGYLSIKEFLASVKSRADLETPEGAFFHYQAAELGILFILALLKEQKEPIHHIACIPFYNLCVYKDNINDTYYTAQDVVFPGVKHACPIISPKNSNDKLYMPLGYASIGIFNAPNSMIPNNKKMTVLLPPNLRDVLRTCEINKKHMVICDLTVSSGVVGQTALDHANVIIFDTLRKTVERFDPHGGNFYQTTDKLEYSPNFKAGPEKFLRSTALFDQEAIDKSLEKIFSKELPNYKFIDTEETCPYFGPQAKADAHGGLCVTWSTMYMLLRLLNPKKEPKDITIKMIDGKSSDLLDRTLKFQKYIINILKKNTKEDLIKWRMKQFKNK